MTREEQADWVCRLRADLTNGVIFTPWNKEFTEALTGVLEQEPCEDVISIQAVIVWLKSKDIIKLSSQADTARKELKALSVATPRPKTGHWIDRDEKSAVCSCCNRNNTLFGDYCKWCGAKMVEPQESEDEK